MKKALINLLISIVILFIIFSLKSEDLYSINFQITLDNNFFLFFLFKIISLFLLALRWNFMCKIHGYQTNMFYSFLQIILGHFLSFFLPGFFAQDIIKFYITSKLNEFVQKKDILIISIYDRLIGLLAFLLLNSIIIFIWVINSGKSEMLIKYLYSLDLKYLTLLIFLIIFSFLVFCNIIMNSIIKLIQNLRTIFNQFLKMFFLAVFGHFFNLIAMTLLILEMSNLDFFINMVLISISLFGNLFPFTPTGIGVTELLFQEIYLLYNNTLGLEIGVIIRLYSMLIVLSITLISILIYAYMKVSQYVKNKN